MYFAAVDETTLQLAAFAGTLRYEDLPPEVVHEARRRLVDTLGCALGGFTSAPAKIARDLAAECVVTSEGRGARVLGLSERVEPGMAAFANGLMARYLDYNDSFASSAVSGGHPSDMVPAILSLADASHRSGRAAILALVAAYQANAAVPVPFKKLGWDQGVMVGIGGVVGLASLLGLDIEQTGNALSLTVVANLPLRASRSGQLSMWKAGAAAAAGRQAIFATLAAAKGMTGPDKPFEGRHGLWDQATGPFKLCLDPVEYGYRILDTDTKMFPVELGMQAVIPTLLEMTSDLPLSEIDSVDVRTYWGLWFEGASEAEKWDPRTRETADHSLPYVIAVCLRDRGLSLSAFEEDAILDPEIRPIMSRIRVTEDAQLTGDDPTLVGSTEIEITTCAGRLIHGRSGIARGNHENPMSDEELGEKFLGLATLQSTRERSESLLARLWEMDRVEDASEVLDAWASLVE